MDDRIEINTWPTSMTKDAFLDKENIQVGVGTYGVPRLLGFTKRESLVIGKYCSFARDVTFAFNVHHAKWLASYPLEMYFTQGRSSESSYSKGSLVIGNDVWIGHVAFIMSGITIGDGAVVGACSVVTKDIPPYAIVVGNPAKVAGYRFDNRQIEFFLKTKWWDWSEEKIGRFMKILCSGNFDEFVSKVTEES